MTNLQVVNFLDITFNLSESRLKPFHEDKQILSYINAILTTIDRGLDKSQMLQI